MSGMRDFGSDASFFWGKSDRLWEAFLRVKLGWEQFRTLYTAPFPASLLGPHGIWQGMERRSCLRIYPVKITTRNSITACASGKLYSHLDSGQCERDVLCLLWKETRILWPGEGIGVENERSRKPPTKETSSPHAVFDHPFLKI